MSLFRKKKDVDIKYELEKHGYRLKNIISESEKDIRFLEYDNCCSNEYKSSILKNSCILICDSNKKLVDKIKI